MDPIKTNGIEGDFLENTGRASTACILELLVAILLAQKKPENGVSMEEHRAKKWGENRHTPYLNLALMLKRIIFKCLFKQLQLFSLVF